MGLHNIGRDMKALLLIPCLVVGALGHGRLMNPPSRASQWRLGFDNPKDYNDNQGFCGGKIHQHQEMGGKCGVCGDPWDANPREHEAPGGIYANGNIVAEYKQGQDVDVAIEGFLELNGLPSSTVELRSMYPPVD